MWLSEAYFCLVCYIIMVSIAQTKLYLDNCSFNRPYDSQLYPMIMLETEAKLLIQHEVLKGNLGLVWSFIVCDGFDTQDLAM